MCSRDLCTGVKRPRGMVWCAHIPSPAQRGAFCGAPLSSLFHYLGRRSHTGTVHLVNISFRKLKKYQARVLRSDIESLLTHQGNPISRMIFFIKYSNIRNHYGPIV